MVEYKIGGILVVDDNRYLVGIVINCDFCFECNMDKCIDEVMIKENLVIINQLIDLEVVLQILQYYKIEKLLVVDKEGKLIGLVIYKDIIKVKDKFMVCKDLKGCLCVVVGVGVMVDIFDCMQVLVDVGVDVIVIDMVYGYLKGVIDMLCEVKKCYFDIDIVVGNIVMGDVVKVLVEVGVDGVKVGIGLGFICMICVVVGVGVFQFLVVYDVVKVLKGMGIFLIVDGGFCYLGDVVKVLVVGGYSVMIGLLVVGIEESLGEMIIFNGCKFKLYCGMGLFEVMENGLKDCYFQSGEMDVKKLVFEGIVVCVFYKGILYEVIY